MACMQENFVNLSLCSDMISNAVKSFTLSKRFTRALMKTSMLNILYQRLVLNESDLKSRRLNNVPFMVFKRKQPKDPLLRQYLNWVEGIEDAIKKNYLKEVFIFMKNPVSGEVVETYRFHLKYNTDDTIAPVRTSNQVKRATKDLLNVINQLGKNNDKLTENTNVKLELTYFETTPSMYEPPGFEAAVEKNCLSNPIDCGNHLGTVKTGFHKLSCYGTGEVFNRMNSPIPILTEVVENEAENDDLSKRSTDNVVAGEVVPSPEKCVGAKRSAPLLNTSSITVSDVHDGNISITSGISIECIEEWYACICKVVIPLDVELIECIDCNKQYHAPCHGFLSKEDAYKAKFSCICCRTNDSLLRAIAVSERPQVARLRLVLYYIDKRGQLPIDVMKILSESHRSNILEKLNGFGVLIDKNNRVNQVKLRKVIEKFFELNDSQTFENV